MLVPAYAKVNLYLEVEKKLDNGYHELKMLMQRISLYDDLHIKKNNTGELKVYILNNETFDVGSCNEKIDLSNKNNIVFKTALKLIDTYDLDFGINIGIRKRIPIQAGLGGGSADAASALLALNSYFQLGLSIGELCDIGKDIGADVPFCLTGGTAVVHGIGEILEPVAIEKEYYLVIVKPLEIGISTKAAFNCYDTLTAEQGKNMDRNAGGLEQLKSALAKGDYSNIISSMHNSLEKPAFLLSPNLQGYKDRLMSIGGNAMMTGSGSAVFALFDEYDRAVNCFERIKKIENQAQVFFAKTI